MLYGYKDLYEWCRHNNNNNISPFSDLFITPGLEAWTQTVTSSSGMNFHALLYKLLSLLMWPSHSDSAEMLDMFHPPPFFYLPKYERCMHTHAHTRTTNTQTHGFAQVCSHVKRNLTYLTDRNYSYAALLTPRCSAWETMLWHYPLIPAQIAETDGRTDG